uniref:PAX transactivation activation domain-interacting protein n=1 Tax=Ditylenchus dipsaci TaxID=166011 RepID=A0A915EE52_9BILA
MSPTLGAVQLNPNQLQQIPTRQQIFPGPLPNANIALQQQQLMRMPFIGHEPQGAQGARSYSPEICLAGCVFLILDDYSPTLVDRTAISVTPHDYLIHQALRDGRRRIVTLQWLNETLMKKRIEAPTKACHLPTCWSDNNRPAIGKIITTAGFDELETSNLKAMILAIGGRYTPTLSAHNHLLISKCFNGPAALNNTDLKKPNKWVCLVSTTSGWWRFTLEALDP